ncbi:MAG: 3-phosphoshikimate 1-carboxyvinyltransferase, partial [Ilumatobacteraceae bacterium]
DIRRDGTGLVVSGTDGVIRGGATVSARLAGTTSRFLVALAALGAESTVITGDEPLRRRPLGPLHEALVALGASVEFLEPPASLPVKVTRSHVRGGEISVRGDISSQFLSALMMIGPLLDGGLTIAVVGTLVSAPYVAITERVMRAFGIEGVELSAERITIPMGAYQGCAYDVEPDASSASYPLAAAAICGGEVLVPDLDSDALQGDIGFIEILRTMGCEVESTPIGLRVRGTGRLVGARFDLKDMSDLVPTVAAMAAFATGTTQITGVGFIREKESDRIGDLVAGLRLLGVDAAETDDGLVIDPVPLTRLHGGPLPTHHDHRLAMAWSLVALRLAGVSIDDPGVVAKSWPDWWSVRAQLVASSRGSSG